MNSNMTEQLDQLFRMWDRGLCPGAQVLIRQHGKTLYEKCFGYGNLENKLKIFSMSHRFPKNLLLCLFFFSGKKENLI